MSNKTRFTQTYDEEGGRNYRLLFGCPVNTETVEFSAGKTVKHSYFAPEAVFSVVFWDRNDYGTKNWQIYILRAVWPGEEIIKVPYVSPGAEVLLMGKGKGRVQRILRWLRELEQEKDLHNIDIDNYRAAHARFIVNMKPRDKDSYGEGMLEFMRGGK